MEVLPIQDKFGMNESEWPTSPAGIAELLKRMNDREPIEMTDAEFTAWETARESEKERQKEFTRQSWTQAVVTKESDFAAIRGLDHED